MPARERLSALDAAFLDLDTPAAPLHIGWTMRLSGAAPTLAALRRHLETRLDRVPRFRRCLAGPALGAGAATWSDDPGFDIARHVQAMTLAAPGGPAELRALAGRLLSVPLDGGRPLWRITLVDGLRPTPGESPDEGAFALVGQVHHALVDAVAALEVAALLLFDDQSRPVSAHSGPAPAGRRSPAVRRPLVAQALEALGAVARPAPATSLDRTAGPERVVAFAETRLEAMRSAARGAGDAITVNDVLLAAVTVALGAALRRRGEHPVALKALVPVDVRAGRDRGLGNAISFLFVDLPVCESDPQRALATITARTSVAKRTGGASAGSTVASAADALPAAGRRALVRLLARATAFNVVVSNIPGPERPMELLGRPVEAMFPAVPIMDGHSLTIGALSYCGRVGIGVYADAVVVPDALEVARDIEAALDALALGCEPAEPPLTPWRRRARDRRSDQRLASR